jgi:N-acylneuraminate cytidylyltransferase
MNVAIIPARGGSKRIPKKNIRMFCGQPMIAYPIKMALSSNIFSRVIISTDDLEVADVAKQYGADVDLRPNRLSGDHVALVDVMRYMADNLVFEECQVCFILATALFFSVSDLKRGQSLLRDPQTFYSLPCQRFPAPIERAFTINSRQQTDMVDSSRYLARSQDCLVSYYDAGQFYWGTKSSWLNPPQDFFGPYTAAFELENRFCIDIDDESDWELAEMLYPVINRGLKYRD